MKKMFNRKGDALSSIIITIVFIIIALIMVPAFRGMQKDNTSSTGAISNSHINFVNEGLNDAGGAAGYQLDVDTWDTTNASGID